MINLHRPVFPDALRETIAADIASILASGRLMSGPWALKFEDQFAAFTGRSHAVSLNTCTTALQIALMFANVNGKDVLVPAGSFVTDISAVLFAGGRPVLVDMNPATLSSRSHRSRAQDHSEHARDNMGASYRHHSRRPCRHS